MFCVNLMFVHLLFILCYFILIHPVAVYHIQRTEVQRVWKVAVRLYVKVVGDDVHERLYRPEPV